MLFIHTHTVYYQFPSGPSQGNNQSICESTATTNNQSTRMSNLPESPLVQSQLSAATVLEDGYNSDAHQNHNAAIEMEGPQELDKPERREVLDPLSPSDNQAEESETNNNQPEFVLIPNNVITKLKVANLKAELSKCGLDTKGLNNVLLNCLYCVETEHVEEVKFLCLNINDDYNHDMDNVDIADQLRNYYGFDHWMRKWKWWWSLLFWAFGVLLVNAYVCYHHCTISIGKCPMSHYDFRKSIALA